LFTDFSHQKQCDTFTVRYTAIQVVTYSELNCMRISSAYTVCGFSSEWLQFNYFSNWIAKFSNQVTNHIASMQFWDPKYWTTIF